jgi:NAD(P)-dependent dehydrogenase (short-subunit alcohol dehydrogenase family)
MNILILGATGAIGSALARQAAARFQDATIICAARDVGRMAAPLQHLPTVAIDLRSEQSIASAADSVSSRVGHLDLLIMASGLLHELPELAPEKRLEDIRGDDVARILAINTIAPMVVAREFLPLLNNKRRSVLAFLGARVGSIADNRLGGWYAYRASKAALVMFNRTLARETARRARHLIPVCLHPGTVDSALSQPFQGRLPAGQVVSPRQCASHLWQVIDGLQPEHAGHHLAWDGEVIPW